MSPRSYIADFDSAVRMVLALANYLDGRDFPLLGGTYPAVAVGSSNGALTHLWGALGIPSLPENIRVAWTND